MGCNILGEIYCVHGVSHCQFLDSVNPLMPGGNKACTHDLAVKREAFQGLI